MKYYLGIDGGGTSTVCYLANEQGKILGYSKTGASTYHATGLENSKKEIKKAVDLAIKKSKICINKCEIACLGLSGIDSKKDLDIMTSMVEELEIAKNVILENDSVIALAGGTGGKDEGVVLIAGTGAIALGINDQGRRKRVGGWGHIIGDEGSGYFIAISGIKAALKSYDGRIENTLLLPMFKEYLNLNEIEEIMELIYIKKMAREEIASMATIVFEAATREDKIAREIITEAAKELGCMVGAVIDGLSLNEKALKIPMVGGVFKSQNKFFIESIENKIKMTAPKAVLIKPEFKPAIGAVILALKADDIEINNELKDNIKKTLLINDFA